MQKWKILQKIGAWISIFAGVVFTITALLGIWGVIGQQDQMLMKSLTSLGIVCFTGLVFSGLGKLGEGASRDTDDTVPSSSASIRAIILFGMAFLTVPHAFVVLFAIWSDLMYSDLMGRAFISFAVLFVGSVVVIKAMSVLEHKNDTRQPAPLPAPTPSAPIAPIAPAAPAAPASPVAGQFPEYQHRQNPPA